MLCNTYYMVRGHQDGIPYSEDGQYDLEPAKLECAHRRTMELEEEAEDRLEWVIIKCTESLVEF